MNDRGSDSDNDDLACMDSPILSAIRSSETNEVYFFKDYLSYVLVYYTPGDTGDNKILYGPSWNGKCFPRLIDRIDCTFDTEASEVYIFNRNSCAYINYANDKILSGPMNIDDMFPALKNTAFENGINSVFRSIKDKEVFLFKNNKYCCIAYDCREQLIGSIGDISDGFPILKGTIFESEIDACFASHKKGGVYFFKDVKYVHIKFTSDSYDVAIPGKVTYVLDGWPCLIGLFIDDEGIIFKENLMDYHYWET